MGRVTQLKATGLQSDLPDAESRGCKTSCLIQSLSRVGDTWPAFISYDLTEAWWDSICLDGRHQNYGVLGNKQSAN